ncbi:hypothetical protein CK203_084431 [Vitis vinifera]|uniref:Uncharacterized protein n=1 Tax=Vitis vinifera TaxID=29760 RepID=A0A438EMW4_VITVI|nr:hypothetical protein CK203_084431 [Vitis vinifera]
MPVVQQRGRFKVTSENVDLEKVVSSPMLQKSHSFQVGSFEVSTFVLKYQLPIILVIGLLVSLPLPLEDQVHDYHYFYDYHFVQMQLLGVGFAAAVHETSKE